MSYANQKLIVIHRNIPEKNTKEPYLCIHTDRIETAAKNLNNTAFKLYMYLVCNANNFKLEFSPQFISNTYGISLTSARRAIQELIDAGYVVEESGNRYEFYEVPQKKEKIEFVKEKRAFKMPDGTIRYFTYKEVLEINEGDVAETNADWEGADRR